MKQQGCGDVVGEIAYHAKILPERSKIKFQRITRVDCKFVPGELLLQALDYIPVDFHHVQMIERLQQRSGQGAQSWSNLYHEVAALGTDRGNDCGYGRRVDEEVLAETLARNVLH
jgi:hypothetical protein